MKDRASFDFAIRIQAERCGLQWIDDLQDIASYEAQTGRQFVCFLLGYACRAQNAGNIITARARLHRLPDLWFQNHIFDCALSCLNLDDEWELRRFLELVSVKAPGLVRPIANLGLKSQFGDVQETACDFLSGHHPFDVRPQ